jgi:hypothetical protein
VFVKCARVCVLLFECAFGQGVASVGRGGGGGGGAGGVQGKCCGSLGPVRSQMVASKYGYTGVLQNAFLIRGFLLGYIVIIVVRCVGWDGAGGGGVGGCKHLCPSPTQVRAPTPSHLHKVCPSHACPPPPNVPSLARSATPPRPHSPHRFQWLCRFIAKHNFWTLVASLLKEQGRID